MEADLFHMILLNWARPAPKADPAKQDEDDCRTADRKVAERRDNFSWIAHHVRINCARELDRVSFPGAQ